MISKPQAGEYAIQPATYVNLIKADEDVIAVLAAQRDISYNLFKDMPDERADYAYAEGKWTVKQSLGHMIDTERTFIYRAFAISRGYVELPGFDQDEYVANSTYSSQSISGLAEEFKLLRDSNLYLIRALTPQQQERTGMASGNKISVRALIYMAAGHERYHYHLLRDRYQITI